jgi:hypothetical protein
MAETLDDVQRDNLKKELNKMHYAEFDRKVERHFQGHPELKPGRDFRANTMRFQVGGERIAERFDETFSESPDSPGWWEKEFCVGCGRRHSLCRCK